MIRFALRSHKSSLAASTMTLQRAFTQVTAGAAESALNAWTTNAKLKSWVAANIKLMAPDNVHLCDGASICKHIAKLQEKNEKKRF